jgi:proline iminopeptidase
VSVTDAYPEIEPFDHGLLEVGDGNLVYWETCGNPEGKPAVVFHGGPGSGCSPWFRTLFDPSAYLVVLFDQRNCGRSKPHASDPATDLSANTTQNLIADAELLRQRLNLERWLVFGGSWGSTLALAYAETHPDRVTEMVLVGVTTGRKSEFDWLFRGGVALLFPEQWERLLVALPPSERDGDVVDAYHRLLNDEDPDVRRRAVEAWCLWESATPAWPPTDGLAERFRDPDYALAFARIVTHYVCHNAWLEDDVLLRNAGRLATIPGVLVNGRFDFQTPIANAYELRRAWPQAELVIVDDAGHVPTGEIAREIVRATDSFR